uniref:Uncharacterized protein n=1 Tax=Arundo donax TaxID=35708 RepID=A0A0A8XQJ1_ARUDO
MLYAETNKFCSVVWWCRQQTQPACFPTELS